MPASTLKGKFLLAAMQMGDPNFVRSVILLIEHDQDGAMGLIVNRPTDVAVADVLTDEDVEIRLDSGDASMLFRGGPCDGPLMVLHGGHISELGEVGFPPLAASDSRQVLEGIWFGSDRTIVEPALTGAIRPARFFAGYAGWGAGQLEAEIDESAWTVIEGDAATLWEPDKLFKGLPSGPETASPLSGDELWRSLTQRQAASDFMKGWNPKIFPSDPSMN